MVRSGGELARQPLTFRIGGVAVAVGVYPASQAAVLPPEVRRGEVDRQLGAAGEQAVEGVPLSRAQRADRTHLLDAGRYSGMSCRFRCSQRRRIRARLLPNRT